MNVSYEQMSGTFFGVLIKCGFSEADASSLAEIFTDNTFDGVFVITSYSIHYTKLYEVYSEDGDFMQSKGREIMRQVLKRFNPKDINVL